MDPGEPTAELVELRGGKDRLVGHSARLVLSHWSAPSGGFVTTLGKAIRGHYHRYLHVVSSSRLSTSQG